MTATSEPLLPEVEPGTRPYPRMKWIAVDFDGTIATSLWTPENPTRKAGPPLPGVRGKLAELAEAGYKPVIHTARGWTDYEYLEWYCQFHDLPIRRIVCGKLLAVRYIDDLNLDMNSPSWVPGVTVVVRRRPLTPPAGGKPGTVAPPRMSKKNKRTSCGFCSVNPARHDLCPGSIQNGRNAAVKTWTCICAEKEPERHPRYSGR